MKKLLVSAVAGLLAIVGCARTEPAQPASTTSLTSAIVAPSDVAIREITAERCSRAISCDRVGPHKTYITSEQCSREAGYDTYVSLRSPLCPNGVHSPELSTCLDQLRTAPCNAMVDVLEGISVCNNATLCH